MTITKLHLGLFDFPIVMAYFIVLIYFLNYFYKAYYQNVCTKDNFHICMCLICLPKMHVVCFESVHVARTCLLFLCLLHVHG